MAIPFLTLLFKEWAKADTKKLKPEPEKIQGVLSSKKQINKGEK